MSQDVITNTQQLRIEALNQAIKVGSQRAGMGVETSITEVLTIADKFTTFLYQGIKPEAKDGPQE